MRVKVDADYVSGLVIGAGVAASFLAASWVGVGLYLVGMAGGRIVQLLTHPRPRVTIAQAWRVIEACPHRNPDDGCCAHPRNMTPECHANVCPLADG